MNRPVIFVSNFHPLITRNILHSGILERLSAHADIVLFVHDHKEEYFRTHYAGDHIIVEGINVEQWIKSRKNRFFTRIADWLLDTNVRKFRKLENLEKTGHVVRYYGSLLFTALLGRIMLFKKFMRYLDGLINNPKPLDLFFAKYKPKIVFATDIFNEHDILLLKNARTRDVRTLSMVRSWDNTTSIGFARCVPDELIVQNEIMKKEIVKYHAIPEHAIRISGIPQFEEYLNMSPSSREEFFHSIGADPKKQLILFAPAGNFFIDTDWQICQILTDLQNEGSIPRDVQFLIRLHPLMPVDLSGFQANENFIIDITGPALAQATSTTKMGGELKEDFYQHLFDSLHHVSLVINTISSLIIDAMAMEKPLITINFNGWEKRVPFLKSLKRWRMEENQMSWMSFGATRLVANKEELAEWINNYLNNPMLDAVKRKAFKRAYCGAYDGRSAERITSYVLNLALS